MKSLWNRVWSICLVQVFLLGYFTACASSPKPAGAPNVPASNVAGEGTSKAASVSSPIPPLRVKKSANPITIRYREGTMGYLNFAVRAFLKNDLELAEKEAMNVLEYEPRCIEAQWLLVNVYSEKGELGKMIQILEKLGVREAKESLFVSEIVASGSKGYVVEVQDTMVKIDYTQEDGVAVNDAFVIYDEGSVLQHPVTMEILFVEKRLVAEAEIRSVHGSYSIAEVVTPPAIPLRRGMRVIPKGEFTEFTQNRK